MLRTKKTLYWVSALIFGLLLTLSSGALDLSSPTETGQSVETLSTAANLTTCGEAEVIDFGIPFKQEFGFIECALDFSCTMVCQATQHACIMACNGNQACQQQCIDEGEQCAFNNCCL